MGREGEENVEWVICSGKKGVICVYGKVWERMD